jgi:hypothetical protein
MAFKVFSLLVDATQIILVVASFPKNSALAEFTGHPAIALTTRFLLLYTYVTNEKYLVVFSGGIVPHATSASFDDNRCAPLQSPGASRRNTRAYCIPGFPIPSLSPSPFRARVRSVSTSCVNAISTEASST